MTTIMGKYTPPAPEEVGAGTDWSRRDDATSLPGDAFAVFDALDADNQALVRADFIEHFGRYRIEDGTVVLPREYLIIPGQRKTHGRWPRIGGAH